MYLALPHQPRPRKSCRCGNETLLAGVTFTAHSLNSLPGQAHPGETCGAVPVSWTLNRPKKEVPGPRPHQIHPPACLWCLWRLVRATERGGHCHWRRALTGLLCGRQHVSRFVLILFFASASTQLPLSPLHLPPSPDPEPFSFLFLPSPFSRPHRLFYLPDHSLPGGTRRRPKPCQCGRRTG